MSKTRLALEEVEDGTMSVEVTGKGSRLASMLASAMEDDEDLRKVVLLATVAILKRESKNMDMTDMFEALYKRDKNNSNLN